MTENQLGRIISLESQVNLLERMLKEALMLAGVKADLLRQAECVIVNQRKALTELQERRASK